MATPYLANLLAWGPAFLMGPLAVALHPIRSNAWLPLLLVHDGAMGWASTDYYLDECDSDEEAKETALAFCYLVRNSMAGWSDR